MNANWKGLAVRKVSIKSIRKTGWLRCTDPMAFVGHALFETRVLRVLSLFTVYSGTDKSLARPGRKQATATEDFEFHIFYL